MNSSTNSTAHNVALDILRSKLIKANGPVLTSAVSFEMDWKKRFKKDLLSFEIWAKTLPPEEFIFVKGEIGRGTIAYNFANVAATGGMAGTSQYFTSKNDDVNILAQWATNGVGKKLIEKFGFSEKDIAVGPTSTTSMPKGQGLGYSNRQSHPPLGGTQISGIKEEKLELGTALVNDYFCHQQNLAQMKESNNASESKGQPGWYEDRSAASPSMVFNSADSSSSVRLENGGGNETSNTEAAGVGSKRKADWLESTNNGSSSIPINNKQPSVLALQELLSIFLCELQQMLASKQVSKEWAAALLLDTARAVILSKDSPSDS